MRRAPIIIAGIAASVAAVTTTAAFADGGSSSAKATMRLADGTRIGKVRFHEHHGLTEVRVSLSVPAGATAVRAFHGFHIHANDNPANGDGCLAESALASTWFVSADGHYKHDGEIHADHAGDMPSLHLNSDGTADATFTIERVDIDELAGRVVILHAGADNFGNVPIGTEPNQYTPNSQEAVDRTRATGNAGDRVACGEIAVR